MTQKGYGGVDIDFEYVLAEDRIKYAEFVKLVRQVMNLFGYQVSVCLLYTSDIKQPDFRRESLSLFRCGSVADETPGR